MPNSAQYPTEVVETLAVFVDLFNSLRDDVDITWLSGELSKRGQIIEKTAVADFSRVWWGVQKSLLAHGFRMVHAPKLNNNGDDDEGGKIIDDQLLIREVHSCLRKFPQVTTYVLATGDGDFTPLVATLHDHGKKVILITGERSLSGWLLESLIGEDELILADQRDSANMDVPPFLNGRSEADTGGQKDRVTASS
ncbi:MAG: NYN domain-containing protein [Candidatus Binatia bacterium]